MLQSTLCIPKIMKIMGAFPMFKADYHVHSFKSFDADPGADIGKIYEASVAKGLDEVALCEHYDVNWVAAGENPEIDFPDSLEKMKAAQVQFGGGGKNTRFLLGIELGQPHQFPGKAAEVLGKNDFDFVLCALHNARDEEDFYCIDYKNTDVSTLIAIFEKYTEELCELAGWGEFHSLAHITYPLRYLFLNEIHIQPAKYADLYKKLFRALVARGIALEVNTSGMRNPMLSPSPPFDLLKLYRESGGELVTVGSDAHNASDIFAGIPYICERLRSLGFGYIATVEDKKLKPKKIEAWSY